MIKRLLYIFFALPMFASAQQELKLWYKAPAKEWTSALPIGNGRLGAMIFGDPMQEHLQFNEETLWTGGPRDYNRKGAYQYLDTIRQLLFSGKQKEAETLAELHFMGMKSEEGKRAEWLLSMRSLKGMKGDPSAENYDDQDWKLMQVPSWDGWEAQGMEGLDGAVWLRTSFVLPNDWTEKDLVLDLNRIRDLDFTFVNGKLVGSMETQDPRKYSIARALLHAGVNTISIQVINFNDKGGIAGYKDTSRHIGIYPLGEEKNMISLLKQWKYFIQDDAPPAVPKYQADYQPFGDLYLSFKNEGAVENYRRELDLNTAIAETRFTINGVKYRREYFSSQPAQTIVVHLAADKKASIDFTAVLTSVHKNHSVRKAGNNSISLSVKVKDGVLRGESLLNIVVQGGKVYEQDGKIVVEDADDATLYLTAATNYKNYKDVSADPQAICKRMMRLSAGMTYKNVRTAHIKEYQQYFKTFSIDLGKDQYGKLPTDERLKNFAASSDPAFAALYLQYGRYLLIAASRPGTRPANLQGIWNPLLMPPWGSKYTTNINLEMNYWPAELLNLSPMHQPLFDMIGELAKSGKETAREYYHARGWVLHHNTDLWRGTAPINASNHGIWVTGGAWLCHHLWEHYLFTQDKNFLRKTAYPLMKEAALFFDDYLVKDPSTGWLISTPSNSPEQGGLVAGPTMDHQIIRDLFKNVIAAAQLLHIDKELADTLQKKYSQIAPNKIGKYGQLQEWMQDKDDTTNKHRHVSHLWAVFPGSEINGDETPFLLYAARQSLLYRGDAATGWSLAWKINLWARFKDAEHTYRMIKMLLSPTAGAGGSYPNLFDAHPPFQIDGNFGGAAGIGEMLIQSHTKYIDILPALPQELRQGSVKGICARGGFVFNIKWTDNKLTEMELLSKAGEDCQLRYNGKSINLKTQKGRTYKLNGALELIR